MRMNGLNGSEDTQTAEAISALAGEMDAIKRLLVLLVKQGGASQNQIALALRSSQGTISKQFRFGNVEPFLTRSERGEEE